MSSNTSSGSSQAPRRTRSTVWEHYEKNLVNVDGELKAVCKYCGLALNSKSGTTSLRGHIANACPAIDTSTRKKFKDSISKQPSVESYVFDQQTSHEGMIKYIIHAEIPFLKFEDPYLQPWLDTLNPAFKVRGRQTIRKDYFKKYEEMKKDLQVKLRNLDSRVCLTSDIWTSSQNIGYMVVTAHFVDAEFKIKKKIIWFKELEYPHSGLAIEEELVRCLTDWDIKEKIFTLTLDNASNNTTACEILVADFKRDLLFGGEHLHVRCCAHILNLLVQDGMRVIHSAIEKIRELLKHIDSSPSRLQVFNSIANQKSLTPKSGIYLDVPTRWNSTFKMLREALIYKSVLNSYAPKYYETAPSEEEWGIAAAICEFLKAFEELTLAVSAHRTSTAHRFLPLVLCIQHALKDPAWQTTLVLKELAASMSTKFEKYWDPDEDNNPSHIPRRKNKEIAFNLALVIATILDPRRKVVYLDFFYKKVCKNADQNDMRVNFAVEWARKYFMEYQQQHRRTSCTDMVACPIEVSAVCSPVLGKRKIEAEFERYKSQVRSGYAAKSEIDLYLEEEIENDREGFDVLEWWKSKEEKYPVLSALARDFLAIPLSTVSSESAFSCSGRILGDHRSKLAPEMLEALVCAKDWLFKSKDPNTEGSTISCLRNEESNTEGEDSENEAQEG